MQPIKVCTHVGATVRTIYRNSLCSSAHRAPFWQKLERTVYVHAYMFRILYYIIIYCMVVVLYRRTVYYNILGLYLYIKICLLANRQRFILTRGVSTDSIIRRIIL